MSVQHIIAEIRRAAPVPLDPVVAAIILVSAALAIFNPQQAAASAAFVGKNAVVILPFLALSIASTAYARASGAENLIARAFAGRQAGMVIIAAVTGALSPFCSCGVIPVIAALLAAGVPLAPVMAFWLASPLIDPSSFVLTVGILGLHFAVAKTVAAIGVGLLGGFGVIALQSFGALSGPTLNDRAGNGGCAGSRIRNPKAVSWRYWKEPERRDAFRNSLAQNGLLLGKWMLLAFLLESLMIAYVPDGLIAHVAGDGGPASIAVATLVGVPSYLNGNAALPLIAGLIDKGMAPGAAMAFLIGGGVTSIPAALAVWAIARRAVFAAYVAFGAAGAFLSGLIFQAMAG